jgi:predicted esterase
MLTECFSSGSKRRYWTKGEKLPGKDIHIVLHGYGQSVDKPNHLPGRLGLPFVQFIGNFAEDSFLVFPEAGKRKNWRFDKNAYYIRSLLLEVKTDNSSKLFISGFSDGARLVLRLLSTSYLVIDGGLLASTPPINKSLEIFSKLLNFFVSVGEKESILRKKSKVYLDYLKQCKCATHSIIVEDSGHDWPVKYNDLIMSFLREGR